MTTFATYQYFIFLFTGFLAGTIDAIAGGGGLISLPVLILTGMPAHIALGTNKLQASFGTGIATYNYFKKGLITSNTFFSGLFFGFVGTVGGAFLASYLTNRVLMQIIPIFMIGIFLYNIFSPKFGLQEQLPKMKERFFYLLFGFLLGFYDGFFGPGTGTLWIAALIFFLGYNLVKATAYTKIFNLKSNLIACMYFGFIHQVNYKIGVVMALGQLAGGRLGSQLAIRHGASLIRVIFLMVILGTILALFFHHPV
jgi:uncharacterized protein